MTRHAISRTNRRNAPKPPNANATRRGGSGMRDRVVMDADDDGHQCHVCRRVSINRELVELYDDYALACVPCAELLKVRRMARGAM